MIHNRLAYVDCLRAFAAIGIVVFHARVIAIGGPLPVADGWRNAIDTICGAGVPLFFVLSAFLLSMLSSGTTKFEPLPFYAKRFFRIAPLFYVCIAAWSVQRGGPPFMKDLIPNVTFTFNLFPSTADSLVFAGWTIGVEMLFYAVYPMLRLVLPGIALKVSACLAALWISARFDAYIETAGIDPRYELLTVFRFMPIFLVGMLAWDVYARLASLPYARSLACGLLASSLAMFWCVLNHRTPLVSEVCWQGAASALLVVAWSLWPVGAIEPLAFVGRISYSVYLFHGLVIAEMGGSLRSVYALGLSVTPSFLLAIALALAAILPVAAMLYYVVETPGNWVGRHAARWLSRRPADRGRARNAASSPSQVPGDARPLAPHLP